MTITLAFDPAELRPGERPAIYYYDEEEGCWVYLGGTVTGDTIAVAVVHFTPFAVFAVAVPTDFSDLVGHWPDQQVREAARRGLIEGYPDGTFRPEAPVSRLEFTVLMGRALGLQSLTDARLDFTDAGSVPAWSVGQVAAAVEAGLINGFMDGSFRPAGPITRAEMATMAARALGLALDAHGATGFTDDDAIPPWAKAAVKALRLRGIVCGRGGNRFDPEATATRAEAVIIVLPLVHWRQTP